MTSIEQSLPVYRELLEPLGYTDAGTAVGERGETIWYLDGEGVGASLGIREAQGTSGGELDRYAVGLHHLAFEAASREMVDERFRWAREQVFGSRTNLGSGRTSPGTTPCSSTTPTGSSSRSSS